MTLNKFLLIFISLCLVSCGSSSSIQKELDNLPEWVKLKPQANQIYYGIGKARKNGYPDMYIKQAEKEALSDLAQQISVEVKTSSLLYQFEGQDIQSDFYMSKSNIKATDYFEGYSVAKQYENDDYYWTLLEISKSDYLRIKRERKQKILSKSHQFYSEALNLQSNKSFKKACINYCKALELLKPYWNESTEFTTNNKTIDLSQKSLENLSLIFEGLKIETLKQNLEVKKGDNINSNENLFQILNNVSPLVDFPYYSEYSEYLGDKRKMYSTENGNSTSYGFKIGSKNDEEKIKISLNSKLIINELTKDLLLRKILYNQINFNISNSINLRIIHPEIKLVINTNLSKDNKTLLQNSITSGVVKKGIKVNYSSKKSFIYELSIKRISQDKFNLRSTLRNTKQNIIFENNRNVNIDIMIYNSEEEIMYDLDNSINRNELEYLKNKL